LILDEQVMTVGALVWSTGDANKVVQVQLSLQRGESTWRVLQKNDVT
jgi:ribosomal protein S28E/S33